MLNAAMDVSLVKCTKVSLISDLLCLTFQFLNRIF